MGRVRTGSVLLSVVNDSRSPLSPPLRARERLRPLARLSVAVPLLVGTVALLSARMGLTAAATYARGLLAAGQPEGPDLRLLETADGIVALMLAFGAMDLLVVVLAGRKVIYALSAVWFAVLIAVASWMIAGVEPLERLFALPSTTAHLTMAGMGALGLLASLWSWRTTPTGWDWLSPP